MTDLTFIASTGQYSTNFHKNNKDAHLRPIDWLRLSQLKGFQYLRDVRDVNSYEEYSEMTIPFDNIYFIVLENETPFEKSRIMRAEMIQTLQMCVSAKIGGYELEGRAHRGIASEATLEQIMYKNSFFVPLTMAKAQYLGESTAFDRYMYNMAFDLILVNAKATFLVPMPERFK